MIIAVVPRRHYSLLPVAVLVDHLLLHLDEHVAVLVPLQLLDVQN